MNLHADRDQDVRRQILYNLYLYHHNYKVALFRHYMRRRVSLSPHLHLHRISY